MKCEYYLTPPFSVSELPLVHKFMLQRSNLFIEIEYNLKILAP